MFQCRPRPGARLTHLLATIVLCGGLAVAALEGWSAETAERAGADYHESALQMLAEGHVRAAIIELKNAVQSDPTYLPARLLLAQAYIREEAGAEAELELQNAEMLGADPALLIVPMAKALLLQQKYDAVLELFDPAQHETQIRQQLLVARGEAYLEISQFDAAREEYAAAREVDPEAVDPYIGLARVALQQNHLLAAATHITSAVEKGPRSGQAWFTKASIDHVQGNLSDAEKSYARVLELDTHHLEARLAHAGVLIDLGEDARAMAEVESLRIDQPLDPRSTYLHAILLTRAGDPEAVHEALLRTARNLRGIGEVAISGSGQYLLIARSTFFDLGEMDIAMDYLKRYLYREPRNTAMRKMLGKIRLQRAQHKLAIEALEPGLDMSPNDPELLLLLSSAYTGANRHIDATPLLEKALDLSNGSVAVRTSLAKNRMLRGEAATAMRELEIAYAGDPSRQQAGVLLVIGHTQKKNYDTALHIATRLAEHDPANVALLNLLGRTQASAGMNDAARETFETAVELDERFLAAIHSLADLSLLEGDLSQAREWLTKALEMEPDHKPTMIKLSSVEQRDDNTDAAVRWLQKAQGGDRDGVNATLELVQLYLRTDNSQAAIRAAEDAERAHPDDLNVLAAIGQSHLAAGEQNLAAVVFSRMEKLAGYQPDALLEIAQYQLAAGRPEDAVWTLQKAHQSRPESIPVISALVRAQLVAGLFAEAKELADQVLKDDPESADGHRLLGDVILLSWRPWGPPRTVLPQRWRSAPIPMWPCASLRRSRPPVTTPGP